MSSSSAGLISSVFECSVMPSEHDSVDYKMRADIIAAIEAHGDVRVWGSFSG